MLNSTPFSLQSPSMSALKQHILLVEDDPAIATSLKVTFKREQWNLTWLDTVGAVLPMLKQIFHDQQYPTRANNGEKTQLSAIILDVGLPDGDGLSLCQAIRACDDIGYIKHLPIIFLTARDDEIDRILGLEVGADDYCPKPFSPRELIARIKAIWRRQDVFDNKKQANSHNLVEDTEQSFTLPSGNWQFLPQTYQLLWNGVKLDVSNTERKLMLYMLQNSQQVFSREQLLSAITDYPDHRLARTVDSHVKSMRKILANIDDSVEVIYTHRGIGYGLCKS